MTPTDQPIEREVKLDVDPDFVVPELGDVVDRTSSRPDQTLRATYFDSTDLRLWSLGITLRHRVGEESTSGTWTLKLPEGSSEGLVERAELEWDGPVLREPPDLQRILLGVLRRQPVVPLLELESHRHRLTLYQRGGSVLGELDDDRVTVHGGPRHGLQFRQIEVELAAQDPGLAGAVVGRLRSAGATFSPVGPKVARGLGDQNMGPFPPPSPLGRKATLAAVARRSLQQGYSDMVARDYRLRVRPGSPAPEDIHKCRVAARRLRSDLKTLQGVLDPVWTKHLRSDLKWVGAALGQVRDIDVLQAELEVEQEGLSDEGVSMLVAALRSQRVAASRSLDEVLDSARYITLLDKLHAASDRVPLRVDPGATPPGLAPEAPARAYLPVLVHQAYDTMAKTAGRSKRSEYSDHRLHQVRIKAKRVRYAAELATPIVGKPARRAARAAEHLQEVLGDHQDAVVADRWLRSRLGRDPSIADFAAGQKSAEQSVRRRRARTEWPAAWKQMRQAEKRWRRR